MHLSVGRVVQSRTDYLAPNRTHETRSRRSTAIDSVNVGYFFRTSDDADGPASFNFRSAQFHSRFATYTTVAYDSSQSVRRYRISPSDSSPFIVSKNFSIASRWKHSSNIVSMSIEGSVLNSGNRPRSPDPSGRIDGGEGGAEADDGGVLDQDVGEEGEFRRETVPGLSGEVRQSIGNAEAKELDELGGEPLVEPVVAVDRVVGDAGVVGVTESVQSALDLRASIQDEGETRGHGGRACDSARRSRSPRRGDGSRPEGRGRQEHRGTPWWRSPIWAGTFRTRAASGQVGGMHHPLTWERPQEPTRSRSKDPLSDYGVFSGIIGDPPRRVAPLESHLNRAADPRPQHTLSRSLPLKMDPGQPDQHSGGRGPGSIGRKLPPTKPEEPDNAWEVFLEAN